MARPKRITNILAGLFVALAILFMLFPLRSFSGTLPAHLLGIIGTLIMLMSLVYPVRKRLLGQKGGKNALKMHIYYGLLGPILVMMHAGSFQASPIAAIAFLSMLVVVFSGIVGNILFVKVSRTLREYKAEFEALKEYYNLRRKDVDEFLCLNLLWGKSSIMDFFFPSDMDKKAGPKTMTRCRELRDTLTSMAEVEATIQAFNKTKKLFTFWISVHIYGTWLLMAMILVHVVTTVYYGLRWIN